MLPVSNNLYRLWGSTMKRHREILGKSRAEMAEALETTEATLSRWEAGVVMPSDARKIEIAEYLGVPAVSLFPLVKVPS